MKLNVLQSVNDVSNKPLLDSEQKPYPLRKFLVEVLGVVFEDEKNLDGNERYRRGKLAHEIQTQDEPDISIEDIALLKSLIGKAYTSHTVFSLWNILEQK